ncbi:MAG: glycyl-radical enzyme activating protein [Ruminococcaceae bacterium]|nr:glycyl-radical enzyme activating protein [Oscillospiraceae bacterium]
MQGTVFSIEEFSVYDGPGIRTTVFLKGCPLRCTWCHNPEGQEPNPQIVKSPNGCTGCNRCLESAEKVDGRWHYTEESIKNCPMGLLRVSGETVESQGLCERLLKNQGLLQGVTFSGGEPLLQSDFLFACLKTLKGKLHTAIQTCGYCEEAVFREAVSLADYFLFDLKLIREELHRKFTGVSNEKILRNFAYLAKYAKNFVVRIPLIPGVTDTQENILGIIAVLKANEVSYVELLPYNKMAGGKYQMLGRAYCPGFDEQRQVMIPETLLKEHQIRYLVL